MKKVMVLLAAIVLLSLSGLAQADVFNMGGGLTSLDTVIVGNPGNLGETSGNNGWGGPERRNTGQVDYFYKIGKYEVTAAQYCEFLNAVAKTDTYGLFNAMMPINMGCRIIQSGDSGSYVYTVEAGLENRPVNYVSWADSARFANWLHNGQGVANTVAEAYALTENGAYTLNGTMDNAVLNTINRNGSWQWAIASEDEWYKAAYYDFNKGGAGIAGYWDYPMKSEYGGANPLPGTDFAGTNDANWKTDHPYNYSTDVGSFVNSPSAYGTFDQGGNRLERNDTLSLMFSGVISRGVRGGSYWAGTGYEHQMIAVNRAFIYYPQDYEEHNTGFRVVGYSNIKSDITNLPPGLTSLETVPVGDIGNPGEESGNDGWGGFIKQNTGAVAYDYSIGKYEITVGQYTIFLNAVAKTDTYGLYNPNMDFVSGGQEGCYIVRTGVSGYYVYSVRNDDPYLFANRPVNHVSWGDCARFANWMHNGQPRGAQDSTTTEDGAYTLNGAMDNTTLLTVTRNAGWKWALPSEDEWYKAAYYDPNKDGVGISGYWDYPMKSEYGSILPGRSYTGNNDANYQGYTSENNFELESYFKRNLVSQFVNSPSAYGTFDQGGNVWERNDTVIQLGYPAAPGVMGFGLRGSCYRTTGEHYMWSVARNPIYPLDFEWQGIGFRVVKAPVAALGSLTGTVNLLDFGGDLTSIPVTVELNGTPYNLNLDADGNFTITDLADGIYDVRIKASHWLARMTAGVEVAGDAIMFPVSLINGDVEINNEVDFDDINATRTAYGSFPGDGNWNELADVDGSLEVDFTDINIVRGNYGEIGD